MNKENNNLILVVDDNHFVLKSIPMLLQDGGFSIYACESAKDAITALHQNEIGVVLTDIKMPEISGLELLEEIQNINPEMPVILMTAYADLDIAVEAIKKGAFDFITKPLNEEMLVHSIKKALNYNRFRQLEKKYKCMLEDTVKINTQGLNKKFLIRMNQELRIPMILILDMLDSAFNKELTGAQRECIELIKRTARAMFDLLDDNNFAV